MKCQVCGTAVGNSTVCPVCDTPVKSVQNNTGASKSAATTYKRSRELLLLCAFLGINDLYLYDFSRFAKKFFVGIITILIGYVIWQISDIIKIIKGGFPVDAHGNPIVWG